MTTMRSPGSGSLARRVGVGHGSGGCSKTPEGSSPPPVDHRQQRRAPSPTTGGGGRQQRDHAQHRRCCRRRRRSGVSMMIRSAFIALLFLWIVLGSLSLAQIHLSSSADRRDDVVVVGAAGAGNHSRHDNNKIVASQSVDEVVVGMGNGVVSFLLGATNDDSGRRRVEYDFVLVFYVLMLTNVLTMLPSLFGWLIMTMGASRRRRRRRRRDGRTTTTTTGRGIVVGSEEDKGGAIIAITTTSAGEELERRSHAHASLLRTYLPAYLLAACADWLQGPYKYALYSGYGYTRRDIAHLFVAGYGSGMVLGGIIGGLADTYGRRRLCLCYCASYAISVLTKHCRSFRVLLVGRAFGGVATSLLFSVFDSWFICAHGERGLGRRVVADVGREAGGEGGGGLTKEEEERWLARGLSASSYGSSLVAIGSGVIANRVVANSGKIRPVYGNDGGGGAGLGYGSSLYVGGYISAFDACLVPLALCATMILLFWEENYGDSTTAPVTTKGGKDEEEPSLVDDGDCAAERRRDKKRSMHSKKHSSMIFEDDDGPVVEGVNAGVERGECVTLLTEKVIDHRGGSSPSKERQKNNNGGMFSTLLDGVHTVWNSPEILTCCIVGSVFEGAMYIFIFLWTPTLTSLQEKLDHARVSDSVDETSVVENVARDPHGESDLPFGWIFSTFMVSCMLGTIAFSRLSSAGISASKCLSGILGLASLSCLAMARPLSSVVRESTSSACTLQYAGMLLYEFCIGFYYPAMGTVKGAIVPEDQRAAIYNVFRLPLNLFMLAFLVGDFSTESSFTANAALLILTCMLQIRLAARGDSDVGAT